jgi:hypothetical protein
MKRLPVRMAPMIRSMLSMVSSPRSWKRANTLRARLFSKSVDCPPGEGRCARRKVKRSTVINIQRLAKV